MKYIAYLCLVSALAQPAFANNSYQKFRRDLPKIASKKGVVFVPEISGIKKARVALETQVSYGGLVLMTVASAAGIGGAAYAQDWGTRIFASAGGVCFGMGAYWQISTIRNPEIIMSIDADGILASNEYVVTWANLKTIVTREEYQDHWHTGTTLLFQDKTGKVLWKYECSNTVLGFTTGPLTASELLELINYIRYQ